MLFKDVIGQAELKNHFVQEINSGKISHAQLFLGNTGFGGLPLALAFVQYLFCENELKDLLKPDFKHEVLFDEKFHTKRKLSAAEEQALFDIKYYLKANLLFLILKRCRLILHYRCLNKQSIWIHLF